MAFGNDDKEGNLHEWTGPFILVFFLTFYYCQLPRLFIFYHILWNLNASGGWAGLRSINLFGFTSKINILVT